MNATLKDLGWANGWQDRPAELTAHEELAKAGDHPGMKLVSTGSTHRYTCEACGITYQVDSGD